MARRTRSPARGDRVREHARSSPLPREHTVSRRCVSARSRATPEQSRSSSYADRLAAQEAHVLPARRRRIRRETRARYPRWKDRADGRRGSLATRARFRPRPRSPRRLAGFLSTRRAVLDRARQAAHDHAVEVHALRGVLANPRRFRFLAALARSAGRFRDRSQRPLSSK